MFGKMKNATIPIYPTFPIKCVACPATHGGDINQAIADGWHVTVYDTHSQGRVQFAGCPLHFNEWDSESLAFAKGAYAK
jgi:hypothetical protein